MRTDHVVAHEHDALADDENDPTAPFYETEAFSSIWQALRWKHIRARVPVCFKKTIRTRYMLANLFYLGFTIGLLISDFNPYVNGSADTTSTNDTCDSPPASVDDPVTILPFQNKLFFGFAFIHLTSAFLYWWAWYGRSWRDVIMIPEYLNHLEAICYICSTSLYPKQDTFGGYYTRTIHKIELTASTIDLVASIGWIMSWYATYTRTLGRGFTLDDPDVIAFTSTMIGAGLYFIYNIQINLHPEDYNTNVLYTYGDIMFFLGACFYVFAALRDDNWFWFLPFTGQYGVAAGRVVGGTQRPPQFGKPVVLMTDCCKRRKTEKTLDTSEDDQIYRVYL